MRVLFVSDVYFPRVNGVSTSIATFRADLAGAGVDKATLLHALRDLRGGLTATANYPRYTTVKYLKACPWRCSRTGPSKTLVERFARGQLQPLDFVLNHQFAALQLDNL